MMVKQTTDISAALDYQVYFTNNQRLQIVVTGPAVLLFEPNADPSSQDPDAITPDPVAFLSDCVALNFFSATSEPTPQPELRILNTSVDLVANRQEWQIETVNLHPSIFRVLTCMLQARSLHSIQIRSELLPNLMPDLLIETQMPVNFPSRLQSPNFHVDHQVPNLTQSGRVISVTLSNTPNDEELERFYSMFMTWIYLLLLGGYPPEGAHPKASGVIPELAALIDHNVIEQTFTEAFICHEDAFHPIINGLYQLHRTVKSISLVTIR